MPISDKLTQIENNVPLVYNAGYEKGKSEGGDTTEAYNQGVADGKQAQEKAFWDDCSFNGARRNWLCAFAGQGWTATTFKPQGNYIYNNAFQMFFHFNENTVEFDLQAHIERLGVALDFSNTGSANSLFAYARVSRIGTVDFKSVPESSGAYAWQGAFQGCYAHTIDKVIFYESNPPFGTMFNNCSRLTHCIFEGVIAKNGLDLKDSPNLDEESITSVINCLSSTTTGLSVTLSLIAVNREFEGGKEGTDWKNLIATKPNWNIAYA